MSKDSIYLFDIDGTLTNPTQPMEERDVFDFLSWCVGKNFFLVGGGSHDKICSQLPLSIINRSKGIFSSMGNRLVVKGRVIYQNKWKPPVKLLSELLLWHQKSPYPDKGKDFYETRDGMLNFSVIGINASILRRQRYAGWDSFSQERKTIQRSLQKKFPSLDVRIGGQKSIDVQPQGYNKSQASKWIRKNYSKKMIFIGDKCFKGGNDHDICQDLEKNNDGKWFNVKNPEETFRILNIK
jgi:phosphomannomutase